MPHPLRIGVDVRALASPITGTGVYLRELLAALSVLAPAVEVVGYSTKAPAPGALPASQSRLQLGHGLSSKWGTLWLQTAVPKLARVDSVDLFWGPLQVVPLRLIGRVPTVVTVHDLVFLRYPETMSWRNRIALAPFAVRSIERADRVLAVSQTTARDVTAELRLDPERVRVVSNAVHPRFAPVALEIARRAVTEALGVAGDYLLFVGTLEPRKNLAGLLDALEILAGHDRARDGFDGQVVIAGGGGWSQGSLRKRIASHPLGSRLVVTGFLSDDLLPSLYNAARLFVMPSLYEGFGLPVLEAMACGVPVVCSQADPFPEVAGDAARLVAADQPGELARAIDELWRDAELRQMLAQRGLEHAAGFRWERSAGALVGAFEEAIAAFSRRPRSRGDRAADSGPLSRRSSRAPDGGSSTGS